MQLDNHQQLYHIFLSLILIRNIPYWKKDHQKSFFRKFFEFYIDHGYKKCKKKFIFFFTLIAFRNNFYRRRISIDNFIPHFLSHKAYRKKFWYMRVIINCFITHLLIFYQSWTDLDAQPFSEIAFVKLK